MFCLALVIIIVSSPAWPSHITLTVGWWGGWGLELTRISHLSPPNSYSLWVSHPQLSNNYQPITPGMEATLLVRRRCNSSVPLKAPGRSRCHSVHIASLKQGNEETRKRVSTFSARSRASSMSSFSSGSSSCSSTLSSLNSGYNTEAFWNRYKRAPDTSIVTNFFRKYKLIKLVNREENKYHSAADLLDYNLP